jgi:hypothetical protein
MCYRIPVMRRLASSFNEHNISDAEIDEVLTGLIDSPTEIALRPRDYGERVLYIGLTSKRMALVEVGVEDREGELVLGGQPQKA